MCWHDREDEERYRREQERDAKIKKSLPASTTVAVLDKDGKYVGAMPVDWKNKQTIANTIRDLKAWHPNAVKADLTEVNNLRERFNEVRGWNDDYLDHLQASRLPAPTGKAEPYAFAKPGAEWSDELKEAGLYLHRQNVKLLELRA